MRLILYFFSISFCLVSSLTYADGLVVSSSAQQSLRDVNSGAVVTQASRVNTPAAVNEKDGLVALNKMSVQLTILKQESADYQMRTSQHLSAMAAQIGSLNSRINQIKSAVNSGHVSAINSGVLKPLTPTVKTPAVLVAPRKTVSTSSYLTRLTSLGSHITRLEWLMFFSFLLALSLLFTVIRLIRSNRRRFVPTQSVMQDDEFDFLNSEEGMVAKLDLARAYSAMQEYDQMRQVLNDVITHGNDDQAAQARVLLQETESC